MPSFPDLPHTTEADPPILGRLENRRSGGSLPVASISPGRLSPAWHRSVSGSTGLPGAVAPPAPTERSVQICCSKVLVKQIREAGG